MERGVQTYRYSDGTLQRVQWVRPESWEALEFYRPPVTGEALDAFARIYQQYLIPACPWIFGRLRLRRPGGEQRLLRGKLPFVKDICLAENCGYLSQGEGRLLVNSSFFLMDPFDCATVWDRLGLPLGLMLKDGRVENPPLYRREALLVGRDGRVEIRPLGPEDVEPEIAGRRYRPGVDCRVFQRPRYARTPLGRGKDLVILGCRVEAVGRAGCPVPAGGFVLRVPREAAVAVGDRVCYRGLEEWSFGIQVGNSILREGVLTDRFVSRFYNIRRLEPVPYPPSLYPMDFQRGRAARMALGADREGRPMLLWAEGAPKVGYQPDRDSRGASLEELGILCRDLGMHNGINLDGGGSAQLLLEGARALEISDRDGEGRPVERPIPAALRVK